MGSLAQELWHAVQAHGNGQSDFEEIYDLLEEISHSSRFYYSEFGEATISPDTRTGDYAQALQRLIQDQIIEVFGTPPPRRVGQWQTAWCWAHFLNSIHPGKGYVIPLFTTNYDISFEHLRSELEQTHHIYIEDAFHRNLPGAYPWSTKRLSTWQPDDDKEYVWVFRLHGCVAWEKPDSDDMPHVPHAPAYIYFDRNGQPAKDRPSWDRAVIWPSKHKRPFKDPYWTEYRYFLRCLDNAKVLIFLGYGFGDDHIKAAVAEALEYNSHLEIIAISDVASESEFRYRLSPIPSANVNFVKGQFTPEGIGELLEHCNKALRPFV